MHEDAGLHHPGVEVAGGGRQPPTPTVVAPGPVDGVEVVAGVVGVGVQRLAAQQLGARRPEAGGLPERDGGQAQRVHADALGHGGTERQLVGEPVEQGLVVVGVDVVDGIAGGEPVGGGFLAVADLLPPDPLPVGTGQLEVAQVPGQGQAHQVGAPGEVVPQSLLGAVVKAVGVGQLAVAQALRHPRVGVRAASMDGVTDAVIEGANAERADLPLGGLSEQRIVRHLSHVPALAVQVDGVADGVVRDLRQRVLEPVHGLKRVVAHQVEAEAVHPVVDHPGHAGVDHEPLGHAVLGGDVVAAGGHLHVPGGVEAVVVAGDDPVEHAVRILPGGPGVVEDLIEHHLQTHAVDRADHLPELAHARPAVLAARTRIGALGSQPVPGVVAPVVGVGVADGGDGGLGAPGGRGGVGGNLGVVLGGTVLGHGAEVEGGQQVQGVDTGGRETAQVAGAVGGEREGGVGAAQLLGDGGVGGGEIAHVQLVDGAGRVIGDDGAEVLPPGGRFEGALPQVDDDAPARVDGQCPRVRVGNQVRLNRPGGGDVHAYLP